MGPVIQRKGKEREGDDRPGLCYWYGRPPAYPFKGPTLLRAGCDCSRCTVLLLTYMLRPERPIWRRPRVGTYSMCVCVYVGVGVGVGGTYCRIVQVGTLGLAQASSRPVRGYGIGLVYNLNSE